LSTKIINIFITKFLLFIGFIFQSNSNKRKAEFGKRIGRFLAKINKKRFNVGIDNLSYAFPNFSLELIQKINISAYENLGITLMELLSFKYLKPENIDKLIQYKNVELIANSINEGRGAILMSGHFGNWELIALGIGLKLGKPINIIVKSQSNKYLDRILNKYRERFGNVTIEMKNAARNLITVLRKGGCIALLVDQSARGEKDILYPEFFGRPAATYSTPAYLSLKFKVPIFFSVSIRQEDYSYSAEIIEIKSDDLEFNEKGIFELTKRHITALENVIRNYPDHWSWMHKRWKK